MNKDLALNKSETKKIRENSFDLLRIICCIAVIAIHLQVNVTDVDVSTRQGLLSAIPGYLFNSMTRFAVPCFLLLTGGFVLSDERNRDWKYFYKKSVKNIFIPTVGNLSRLVDRKKSEKMVRNVISNTRMQSF